MKPYIILILIISVLWLYESSPICIRIGNRGYTDKRKQVMLLISVLLVGMTIFRGPTVGGDLVNYKIGFELYRGMSFLEFLKERHNDRLFYGTVWLIGKFTSNFQVVIIVIGLLTCYFLLSSIYRYSPCVSLSAFLLFCLGYFAYLYCILRQGLAIAIVFWGYRYIERREYKKYIIVILIASLVHITAVIGMIMLLLVDDHFTRKRVLKYILLFFACIVAARYGITVLTKWYRIDYSQTAVSGKGVKLFLFRSGILFLLCLKYRSVVSANPKIRLFYSSFIVGLALQILAMGLSILTRLTGYYAISLIIIVPYVLQQIHIPRNKVIFGCMTFGIGFMFYVYTLVNDLSGSVPYYFMWNR